MLSVAEPVRPFDWLATLQSKRLVAFDGGGVRSREVKRTLFLFAALAVTHAVRRHVVTSSRPPCKSFGRRAYRST